MRNASIAIFILINVSIVFAYTSHLRLLQLFLVTLSTIIYICLSIKFSNFAKISIVDIEAWAAQIFSMHALLTAIYSITLWSMMVDLRDNIRSVYDYGFILYVGCILLFAIYNMYYFLKKMKI